MNVALVLGGGVALGAYHAGAYAALHEVPELHPTRIAGSSVGAVIGALILGNAPQERMARLRAFWNDAALDTPWSGADMLGDEWRRASNRLAVLQVRALGRARQWSSIPGAGRASRPSTSSPRAATSRTSRRWRSTDGSSRTADSLPTRRRAARSTGATPKAITHAYRAPSYEGGVEKPFNFSRSRSAGPPGSAT